jgi:hypothetical protein
MKLSDSDTGVHPHTLADSFLQAEIFPSFSDALNFAQKLRGDTESLVCYSDILAATQCRSNYKRGKVRSHIKFVANSELFNFTSLTSGHVAGNSLSITDTEPFPLGKSFMTSSDLESPMSVIATQSPHFPEHPNHTFTTKTVDSIFGNYEQRPGAIDSSKEPTKDSDTVPAITQTSRNLVTGALAHFVSSATDLIGSMFDKSSGAASDNSLSLVPQNPKPAYSRQGSGESIRSFAAFKKYFSRSCSRSPVASTYEHNKSENVLTTSNNTNKVNLINLNANASAQRGQGEGKKLPSPPSTSPKSPKTKLAIRPILKKMDSGEQRIVPAVKLKRAAMKIYVANQLIHTFRGKNCRVAAGFVNSEEIADATKRQQEAIAFADAAGLDSKDIFATQQHKDQEEKQEDEEAPWPLPLWLMSPPFVLLSLPSSSYFVS